MGNKTPGNAIRRAGMVGIKKEVLRPISTVTRPVSGGLNVAVKLGQGIKGAVDEATEAINEPGGSAAKWWRDRKSGTLYDGKDMGGAESQIDNHRDALGRGMSSQQKGHIQAFQKKWVADVRAKMNDPAEVARWYPNARQQ